MFQLWQGEMATMLMTQNAIDITCMYGIMSVEDLSDSHMHRAYITFNNGHSLSVIQGQYSYGGKDGLFEIMPSDSNLFDDNDSGDSVCGYLTAERVKYYIKKIAMA